MPEQLAYEFIAWNNCANRCDFCLVKDQEKSTLIQKRKALKDIKAFISSPSFKRGSDILLIGGELFDDKAVQEDLRDFFTFAVTCLQEQIIRFFYINTNLLFRDLSCVEFLLSEINKADLAQSLKFTTSYDSYGRFKNEAARNLMTSNLEYLRNRYPTIPIVVNTILTNEMCNDIMSERFDLVEFSKKYGVFVNLLPHIVLLPEISASKVKVFAVLRKIGESIPGYLNRYIKGMLAESQRVLIRFNNITNELEDCTSKNMECGHSENFVKYDASGSCFLCDLTREFREYL